jgi:hypothetical protein
MKRTLLTLSLIAALATLAATLAFAATAASAPEAHLAAILRTWRANLRAGAIANPTQHFPNPSNGALTSRLQLAASRYHFTVVAVEIFHPRQAAPFVVIKARDKHALAASTPAILHLIDPKTRTTTTAPAGPTRAFYLRRATATAFRS